MLPLAVQLNRKAYRGFWLFRGQGVCLYFIPVVQLSFSLEIHEEYVN